ncbi:phage tail protein I [Moorella sp. E306M]|uniref:phage tail protein I n=1 Tax=Moorella sp. E306M TaxID=2572683 RepID=UPI0010FFB0FA|nr:phage tail protein I [Moorella sp. E306M]GEA17731.1 phage tail protein [Moorella sp. E306M]GEA17800.1 phage tail protein [Moorella sp. E306M]
MTSIRDIRLADILPPNIAKDPKVSAAAQALDGELQAVTAAVDQCLLLARIDELPEPVIDQLAWQFHVDFYEPDLPLEQKRSLVKGTLDWHRRKGTPAAVEELVTAIFGDGEIQEWFEYGGQPYHFKVLTTNTSATTTDVQRFTRAVESVKNARSVLEAIEITATDELNMYFGNAVHIADYQEIRQVV